MQINDYGIILEARKLGEKSLLLTIFSENHGLIKGAINHKRLSSSERVAQPGNLVKFVWKARLIEHLGTLILELIKPISFKIFSEQIKMLMLQSILSTLQIALPEGLNENLLYKETVEFIDILSNSNKAMTEYIHLELSILSQLGFEIDLNICAMTNYVGKLYYLSPKTGRGVTEEAGREYHDKLFIIPDHFYQKEEISLQEFVNSLKITSHFLSQNIFSQKNLLSISGRENLASFLYLKTQLAEVM